MSEVQATSTRGIYKRGSKYQVKIRTALDSGYPRNISKTFRSLTDARRWQIETLSAIEKGTFETREQKKRRIEKEDLEAQVKSLTFGEFFWREASTRNWASETRRKNESNYKKHLAPYWENIPLVDINKPMVETWVTKNLDPAREGTYKNPFELFRSIMLAAVDRELISKCPVDRKMFRPARDQERVSQRHEAHALRLGELMRLSECVSEDLRALVLFAGLIGLRLGELLELRRKDFVYTNAGCSVQVSRAIRGVGKYRKPGGTKTANSNRIIGLPEFLLPVLQAHMDEFSGYGPDGLIFPSPVDLERLEYRNSNSVSMAISRGAKKAGLPRTTAHDLRHTAASLMLNQFGYTVAEARDAMGHGSSEILRRYTHTDSLAMVQKMDRVLEAEFNPGGNVIPFNRQVG